LIEYKENRKYLKRSYNQWIRACTNKTLDPIINVYSKEQIYAENVNFFVDGPNGFPEDPENRQFKLETETRMAADLQTKKR
jgi:hypothetical protein